MRAKGINLLVILGFAIAKRGAAALIADGRCNKKGWLFTANPFNNDTQPAYSILRGSVFAFNS